MNKRFWGIFIVTCFLLIACQSSTISNLDPPIGCRNIAFKNTKICIPNQPQRLATLDLDSFENAVTLGIKPIGSVKADNEVLLTKHLDKVVDLGLIGTPNLEKVLALKPDLILGINIYENLYSQLKGIAPTILVDFEHSGKWQSVFLEMARALNKAPQAQELLKKFHQRLVVFRDINNQEISVIRAYPDRIRMYLQDSFIGTILKQAGFKRPPSQRIDAESALQSFGNPIQIEVGKENISQIDGDIIFIFTAESVKDANQRAIKQLERLKKDPLWQKLKAVRSGKVYNVPSYWIGSGLITANAVVDDLIKYLIEANP